MIYLTYNDAPSGIYSSQVIDVCKFIREQLGVNIKLVAFISLRGFQKNKYRIKCEYSTAIVLPMFPKLKFWKLNAITLYILCFILKEKKVWARGPFAANMALMLKKTGRVTDVCFDARGAYFAELNEYNVVSDTVIKRSIENIERRAIAQSDYCLAVSSQLVNYWKEKYHYQATKHVVIPCTLGPDFRNDFPAKEQLAGYRKKLGVPVDHSLLIYSGSSAGWQSFKLMDDFLVNVLNANKNISVIFLTQHIPDGLRSIQLFNRRIINLWVEAHEVRNILMACDYGILLREESVTNKVASPTKFAEYLAAGLKVLISPNIGDYTKFVQQKECGYVVTRPDETVKLPLINYEGKRLLNQLAREYFFKQAYINQYRTILQ